MDGTSLAAVEIGEDGAGLSAVGMMRDFAAVGIGEDGAGFAAMEIVVDDTRLATIGIEKDGVKHCYFKA